MNLGTFSVALTVKDIKASREFYEKLGFRFHSRLRIHYPYFKEEHRPALRMLRDLL